MRKVDIEFIAGFAIARWARDMNISVVKSREFEDLVRKAVDDALKYIDTAEDFKRDFELELKELLDE
jgi:hypothetical protein